MGRTTSRAPITLNRSDHSRILPCAQNLSRVVRVARRFHDSDPSLHSSNSARKCGQQLFVNMSGNTLVF